ncbi:hypothetical protein [Komagataeibacter kakiaceti]|uniref:hypothetical protein n=1 Tax=Komagataeibacter kakiaceti TaxID=943261 RepID=UPI000AD7731E|nr:hypothetical protein [Komagataeibacter kakiaceti]
MNQTFTRLVVCALLLSVSGCYGPRYHHHGWHGGYGRPHGGPGPYRDGPGRRW